MIDDFQNLSSLLYHEIDVPFYLTLGNHDYGGDGGGWEYYRSLFQIDYSGVSSKWRMPDHYYQFTHENVDFFALDTNAQLFGLDKSQREKMSAWLAESVNEWKIAFGHHPYKSNGPHGNAGKYEGISGVAILSGDGVKSFAEEVWCGKVDLFISGHDHSRQWLEDTCRGSVLVVSGAGAKTTSLKNTNPSLYQSDALGFLYVVIQGDTLTAEFIDATGVVNFTHSLHQPGID